MFFQEELRLNIFEFLVLLCQVEAVSINKNLYAVSVVMDGIYFCNSCKSNHHLCVSHSLNSGQFNSVNENFFNNL